MFRGLNNATRVATSYDRPATPILISSRQRQKKMWLPGFGREAWIEPEEDPGS